MKQFAHITKLALSLALCLLLASCSKEAETTTTGDTESSTAAESAVPAAASEADDVVARVGDQTITFSEINTMMNSSAIVGLSMPAFGTPERDQVRLTLLDKIITANLLYLDALKQGKDKDPAYQRDLQRFSNAILSALYRKKHVTDAVEVSDQEVDEYIKNNIMPGSEETEELRVGIEATIRKQKYKETDARVRADLRNEYNVVINEAQLNPEDDEVRDDSEVVATLDGEDVTWGEVRDLLGTPHNAGSMDARRKALYTMIDTRLMGEKGRAEGLEQERSYQARYGEFRKTSLISRYRSELVESMQPSDEELAAYYEENRDRIHVKELRKIQMVVLPTVEEARAVKQKIVSGELTMYQAAAEYSTVPGAKKTLGEMGWVAKGSGFPELDELTFSLGPGEIGGPIQSPAGWHLVTVQDIRDEYMSDIQDENARNTTRRLIIDEKLDAYVINLRKNEFTVEVYEDNLIRLAQQEVDWYSKVEKEKTVPDEEVKALIEKLQK